MHLHNRVGTLDKAESRLSVCLSDCHTGISVVSASIETGHAQNES